MKNSVAMFQTLFADGRKEANMACGGKKKKKQLNPPYGGIRKEVINGNKSDNTKFYRK